MKRSEISMDHVLSLVFRIGLSLALATVIYGAVILLWQHGKDEVDYLIFDGQPAYLKTLGKIFSETLNNNALSIIQLGILILIATPVVRVISCLILFAIERDLMYVILSAIVLGVLLYANF